MPLDSPWESWNMRHMVQLSSSLERRWNLDFRTLLLCAELGGGAMASAYMLLMPPSIFSEILNLGSCLVSAQIQTRQKPVPWKSSTKIRTLVSGPVFPFQGESGSWASSLNHVILCWGWGGIIVREHLNFSYQLWCGWFPTHPRCSSLSTVSGFAAKWTALCWLFNQCIWGVKEGLELPILPTYWHHHSGTPNLSLI